jgi:hemolysin III
MHVKNNNTDTDTDTNQNPADTGFTIKQEIVHSTIHGFGILFGIISIPILTALAAKNANVLPSLGQVYMDLLF